MLTNITLTTGKVVRLARNFAKDMGKVAASAIVGDPFFTMPSDAQVNLAICRSNKCGFYNDKQGRCSHYDCGCFCVAKTKFAALKCPVGLW